ncbi:MAG: RidA family protein [Rhodanobacteraceae bacterium]
MPRQAINPETLYDSRRIYSQAIRTTSNTVLHCAGQIAVDQDGKLVGRGDVVAQARQDLANVGKLLAEAGATPADVARIRIYVVNHKTEFLEPISAEIAKFFGDVPLPASTWVGVASLARPEYLVEIEVTAVMDR